MRNSERTAISLNIGQILAILGIAWGAFEKYADIRDRIDSSQQHQIQLQSQIGETNEHLARLERK